MKHILFLLLSLALCSPAYATLTIEITEGVEGTLPIAIVPFAWQGPGSVPQNIAAIIQNDLRISGKFAPLEEKLFISQPHQPVDIRYENWRTLKVDSLVVGSIAALPKEKAKQQNYVIKFFLMDVINGKQLTGFSLKTQAGESQLRTIAHIISDKIYKQLIGVDGAFNTDIAYVKATTQQGKRFYELAVSDSDGYNEKVIYKSNQSILSPSWSPDGKYIAYVSYANGKAEVVIQNTRKHNDTIFIRSRHGANSAPVWSPDGRQLALTVHKDGNSDVYTYELATKKFKRITKNYAIDTEPAWMPDGSAILFTSDRGGSPQIYKIAVNKYGVTGRPQRVTFEGSYNTRVRVSPDGRYLTFVHKVEQKFQIAVIDIDSGYMRVLTESKLDESPSFSPNSSMIIYATIYNNRGVLAAVSVDGRAQQRFGFKSGDVKEPIWSPYRKQ